MCDATTKAVCLDLTPDQTKLILEGLAELPFKQVFELIGDLTRQAQAGFASGEAAARFTLDAAQMRLILATLGQMPFNRVSRLLHSMHQQMRINHG
jgi:hypothetical protein